MSDALTAFLRRVARSSDKEQLILRGGVLLRHWCPKLRQADDLDFLALFDCDVEGATARLKAIAAIGVSDGYVFHPDAMTSIATWVETKSPGVRARLGYTCADGAGSMQVDLGFGDPIVPAAEWIEVEDATPIRAVRPETMFGWKVHGIFERGRGKWRAKDLFDVHLIATHLPLDPQIVRESVSIAFSSRGTSIREIEALFTEGWGQSPGSRKKWRKFRELRGAPSFVPETLAEMLVSVRAHLRVFL